MATEDTVASSQEPLLMPLDFYELLRVEHSAEPEECWQAYQRLVAQQPDAECSQEALFARANILRQGADRLMDRDARTAYNLALAESAQVEVCQPDLPGALALIQESGRSQDVLRIGVPWLQQHGQVQAAQDVALSLALAYCDVAGEELSKSKSVSPSCDMLHEALVTLRRHGSAPRLQADIKGALDELVLQYVQEQLQMAPGQPRHARAVQLLGTLLWGQSQAGEPIHHVHNTHAVLASVRPLLSSEDVCTLASQRPPAATVTDAEAYDHALALLAEGVRLRLPQRVHCAQSALAALRDASRQAQEDGAPAPDVQAELVTCAVLLGDADAALGILGIDASSPPDSRENRAAAEASPLARFVLGTSASASDRGDADLLPGLCLLVDRWIAEVLNQSFRQVPSSSAVSLADWGADRQVQLFLRMRDCAPSWELVEAVDRAGRALAGGCSCVADGCVSVLAVVLAGARLLAPGGASAGLGPLLPQWLSTQPDAQPHRYNAAASPAAASGPVGTPPTDSTAGSASGRPRATAADAMDIGIELDSQRLEMLMKENTTVGEMRKRRRQLMDIKQNVAEAQSSDELQVRVSRVLMYDYGQGSSYLASTVETSGEPRPQSSYARSWSPEETAAEEAEAPGGGPLRGGRSTSRSVELGDGAGGAADEASLWMKGGCGEYDEDELGDTGTFQVGRRQQIDLAEQERRMWERRAAHPWELKPVPFKSVVFLMATLLFAIAGTRTYYRIYDAARWGRMGVSGDQASMTMDVEMALGVMESWQEAKAAAMGESHQIGALGRVLEGSMLQQWQQRARETLRRGWHWRYTLVKSEIDNIEVSDNNSWAAVQATFTESAQMLEGSELRDSYSSTYSIQYRLVHRRDGWKIMESSIVR